MAPAIHVVNFVIDHMDVLLQRNEDLTLLIQLKEINKTRDIVQTFKLIQAKFFTDIYHILPYSFRAYEFSPDHRAQQQ